MELESRLDAMQTTLAIDDTLLQWASHEARQHNQSLDAYLEDALRRHLRAAATARATRVQHSPDSAATAAATTDTLVGAR